MMEAREVKTCFISICVKDYAQNTIIQMIILILGSVIMFIHMYQIYFDAFRFEYGSRSFDSRCFKNEFFSKTSVKSHIDLEQTVPRRLFLGSVFLTAVGFPVHCLSPRPTPPRLGGRMSLLVLTRSQQKSRSFLRLKQK